MNKKGVNLFIMMIIRSLLSYNIHSDAHVKCIDTMHTTTRWNVDNSKNLHKILSAPTVRVSV